MRRFLIISYSKDELHTPNCCTLRKATIPMTLSSLHHSWIVWSSIQVPFIVKLRLTNRGFVARYLKWWNWTWGKWNVTDSNNIWAVRGPCTRRSGVNSSNKKIPHLLYTTYRDILLFDNIPCRDGYSVHWTSRQNNGKAWPGMACIRMQSRLY